MRAVIQRVSMASVTINDSKIKNIGNGLVVFIGIEESDKKEDAEWLSKKIVNLRIFDNEYKIPDISIKDIKGEILLISQFTLHAEIKKGNRPSYIKAAKPDFAKPLYMMMICQLENDLGRSVSTGEFGADMKVLLLNDGPLTILADTKAKE